ncbi:MAG: FAD-dependent oxidoreductase [Planctomycetaceae bacterium]
MGDAKETTTDVAIVGAGLGGSTLAAALGARGVRVVLLDPRAVYPECFKAEKVEPDQAVLLRKLGLMEAMSPALTRIHEITSASRAGVFERRKIEQYGALYHDMVNQIRRHLPSSVDYRPTRAREVSASDELQQVTLEEGAVVTARLVVLANGGSKRLAKQLGLQREEISLRHSLTVGFDVARRDGAGFAFDALTYYPRGVATGIGCLSLFPVERRMRANLFTYLDPAGPWVKEFQDAPAQRLRRSLPGLDSFLGEFDVTGKVEWGRIDLYRATGHVRSGVVLIGDAFQGVCPITGTGLSKVLCDVAVLALDCLPRWLATPGMGAEKIAAFYDHPCKKEVDAHSLGSALYSKELALNPSWKWRLRAFRDRWTRRAKLYLRLTR